MNVEIKEIKFRLNNKELSLTIEEAKKMKNLLNELFGVHIVERHHHTHYPIERPIEYMYPRWTCSKTTYTDSGCTMTMDNNILTYQVGG